MHTSSITPGIPNGKFKYSYLKECNPANPMNEKARNISTVGSTPLLGFPQSAEDGDENSKLVDSPKQVHEKTSSIAILKMINSMIGWDQRQEKQQARLSLESRNSAHPGNFLKRDHLKFNYSTRNKHHNLQNEMIKSYALSSALCEEDSHHRVCKCSEPSHSNALAGSTRDQPRPKKLFVIPKPVSQRRKVRTSVSLKRKRRRLIDKNIERTGVISPDEYDSNIDEFATKFSGELNMFAQKDIDKQIKQVKFDPFPENSQFMQDNDTVIGTPKFYLETTKNFLNAKRTSLKYFNSSRNVEKTKFSQKPLDKYAFSEGKGHSLPHRKPRTSNITNSSGK